MNNNHWVNRVHVLRIQPAPDPGSVATADIALGKADRPTLTIRSVRLWRGRSGEIMVSLPPTIKLQDESLRVAVVEAVLDAWRRSVTAETVLMG